MTTLLEALDEFDLALTRADGVVQGDVIERLALVARRLRTRRGFLGDVLVLAIAGGTGSGKSSVLNAIAGEEIASVGRLRPHTDRPLAWVPAGSDVSIDGLLDELGVEERVANHDLPGLAVIDLPDMDSVVSWHRGTVDDLLPRIDAVLWVFDPTKYNDPVLHDEYLRPLAPYHRQFVFLLNKVDLVGRDGGQLIEADLGDVLRDHGYPAPRVIPAAAAPESGGPWGIEELVKHLDQRLDAKLSVMSKVATDLYDAAHEMALPADLWAGAGTRYDGLGDDPRRTVAELAGRVGSVTTERLQSALTGDHPDEAAATALWDRSLLGATLATVGVMVTELIRELDARRLP